MTDAGISLMSNKRKLGGFGKAVMSSNVSRERWMQGFEGRAALQYLQRLESNGAKMFLRHKVDERGRLQHLFWCDSECRFDYTRFGDVLALDTTYGKTKYPYPLVVFSGVNHHIHTIVFVGAIIADETEETYVWLFEQFKEAMEAKSPGLVITEDAIALENAISRFFPNARHRLCAQQILCSASSKVRNPMMIATLKKLMLSDCVASEFDGEWHEMVAQFGLEDQSWVRDMYEKRKMWATACIRGRRFVGFKATSRCDVKFGRLVHSCHNLVDFLLQYHHCLFDWRCREQEAGFKWAYAEPAMQTMFKALERSACKVFTKQVFMLFRPVLARVGTMKVNLCKGTCSSRSIYSVSKYGQPDREWYVHHYPSTSELVCTCMRMENFGIPCDHIVHVMVYLGIAEMPTSLVLKRWTRLAKCIVKGGGSIYEFSSMAQPGSLFDVPKQIRDLFCCSNYDFNDTVEKVRDQFDMSEDNEDDVSFSNDDWNINLNVSSDECGACFSLEDDDEDESDINGGPSFKRRAQRNVDDKW